MRLRGEIEGFVQGRQVCVERLSCGGKECLLAWRWCARCGFLRLLDGGLGGVISTLRVEGGGLKVTLLVDSAL